MPEEERRKYTRFEVEIPLSFSGKQIAGGGLVNGLSKEGCSVLSEEPVQSNTFMALHLHLPEQSSPLRIEVAEVRWTSGIAFGLEFKHLRAEEQERLRRFITWLENTQNN